MIRITEERKGPSPQGLEKGRLRAAELLRDYLEIAKSAPKGTIEKQQAEFLKKLEISSSEYAPEDVKEKLYLSHFGKCAYCETRIIHSQYGDVEHFRPKKGIVSRNKDGKRLVINDAYFWRAFNWDNLVLSCGTCNQTYKKNFFELLPDLRPTKGEADYSGVGPVELEQVAVIRQSPSNPEINEWAVLIDPCSEDPRLFIAFDPRTGEAVPSPLIDLTRSDPKLSYARAARTIAVMGLNRPALLEMRVQHLLRLHLIFMLTLNSWDALKAIKKLGEEYSNQPKMRIDRNLWAIVTDRSRSIGGEYSRPALERLGWSIHPGAEYSALAGDAICQWSLEEFKKEESAFVQAASQAAAAAYHPVSSTFNLYMKYPATLLRSLTIQTPDYEVVIRKYLIERQGVEPTRLRRDFYERMNELIARYKENYTALTKFKGLDHDKRILFNFKEHVSDYYHQIKSRQEQFKDDLDPPIRPGEDKWGSASVKRNKRDEFDEQVRIKREKCLFLLDVTNKVLEYLNVFFNWAAQLESIDDARKGFAGNKPALMAVTERFAEWKRGHSDDREATIYFRDWFSEHDFFTTRIDELLLQRPAISEIYEDVRTEFLSILTDLTLLLYEVNSSGVACTAITDQREKQLKEALKAMIQGMESPETARFPGELSMTAISI